MSPRMYISASFYAGIITDEEKDVLNNELEAAGFLVAEEDDDFVVDGNYAEGYVTVLTFLTSSWGDSLGIDDLKEEYDIFAETVTKYCIDNDKCKLPTFKVGATYW